MTHSEAVLCHAAILVVSPMGYHVVYVNAAVPVTASEAQVIISDPGVKRVHLADSAIYASARERLVRC